MTDEILMTPGPVTVQMSVLEQLSKPMGFHRYEDFEALYSTACKLLHSTYRASDDHAIVIFTGSGTLANEIVLSSAFDRFDKVLVVSNGDFGERLASILSTHGVPIVHLRLKYFEPIDPSEVVKAASEHRVSGVAMVAMETSTGMRNPVNELGRMLRTPTTSTVRFFVDAVSALGYQSINVTESAIAYCTSAPNKGIESVPGVSFACVDLTRLDLQKKIIKSHYLDLSRYIEYGKFNQTPTTPAVPQFRALIQALHLLETESVEGRAKRYEDLTNKVIVGLGKLGIEPAIREPSDRSVAVTVFRLPLGSDTSELRAYLRQHGFIVWFPSHVPDGVNFVPMIVSVMGMVRSHHAEAFTNLLSNKIRRGPTQ